VRAVYLYVLGGRGERPVYITAGRGRGLRLLEDCRKIGGMIYFLVEVGLTMVRRGSPRVRGATNSVKSSSSTFAFFL
jgi:hypothetical protein